MTREQAGSTGDGETAEQRAAGRREPERSAAGRREAEPREAEQREGGEGTLRRIGADPESVERGLVSLVLTVVELLRQLMERQALRRVDDGDLTDSQIEEIGATLMALEERMAELREHFGLSQRDLNLDLGPLGPLLPPE